jgi:hypothetical protein
MAHTCNPHCYVVRDQEDHGWKPVQANGSRDTTLKYPTLNKTVRVAQVVEHLPSKS